MYTIITWKVYESDLAWIDFKLPELNNLPKLDGTKFGPTNEKC